MYPPTTVGNDKQAWLSRGGSDQEGNWKDTFEYTLYGLDENNVESNEKFRIITNN